MRAPKLLPLTACLAICLLAWIWWAFESAPEGAGSVPDTVRVPPAESTAREREALPRVIERPAVTSSSAPDSLAADGPSPEGVTSPAATEVEVPRVFHEATPARFYVDEAWFEGRYGSRALQDLREAKVALEAEVTAGMREATSDFFDSGGGDVQQVPMDATIGAVAPRRSNGLISVSRSQPLADGSRRVETGELPWDDFQSLYDAKDELYWLMREIRRREELAAAGDGG